MKVQFFIVIVEFFKCKTHIHKKETNRRQTI